MAHLYTNENVPLQIVIELRRLGHDVLTSSEAGTANARVPDQLVLAFGNSATRIVVTNNRRDFIRLHRQGDDHVGIVVYTFHPDSTTTAARIASGLADSRATGRFLLRIDGVGFTFDP